MFNTVTFLYKVWCFFYEEIHFLRKRERNIYTHEGEKIEEKSWLK